jgi:hypothetical protein
MELIRDFFFFVCCRRNDPYDAEEIEEVIDTLTEHLAALSQMILMHTLYLLKVMMMKVAHQICMISTNLDVRKKMKLERSMRMLRTR